MSGSTLDLAAIVDALSSGAVLAEQLLDDHTAVDAAKQVVATARTRLGYPGDTVVVALAGGTGVGKSSLLNALAGATIARVSALRPTTTHPIAWLPEHPDPGLLRHLDDLGVHARVPHGSLPGMALIDLPDVDSVDLDHRAFVEHVVPRIDAVVVVVDPQKYADELIHDLLVRPLERHAQRTVVVLNQVDRLTGSEREAVRADLVATLAADGLAAAPVVATSTATGEGIDELRSELTSRLADKRVALRRVLMDVRAAAEELSAQLGDTAELPPWRPARDAAARTLAVELVPDRHVEASAVVGARTARQVGAGPVGRVLHAVRTSRPGRALGAPQDTPPTSTRPAVAPTPTAAVAVLREHVHDTAGAVGGQTGRRLRERLDPDTLQDAVTTVARTSPAGEDRVPRRRWWPVVAAVQWLAALTVVAGVVWIWADPAVLRIGAVPWPALMILVALLVGFWLRRLLVRSGAAAGRELALRRREQLATDAAARLDERVGARRAEILEAHDAAHEALALAAARPGRR